MLKCLEEISKTDEKNLDEWEVKVKFQSYRRLVNSATNEFSSAKTQKSVEGLIKKHSSIIKLNNLDSSIMSQINNPLIESICNKDGMFYVGKSLCKAVDGYILVSEKGNIKDLEISSKNIKTDAQPVQGVRITKITIPSMTLAASTCSSVFNTITVAKNTLRCKFSVYLWAYYNNVYLTISSESQQKIGVAWFAYKTNHNQIITNVKINKSGGTFNTGAYNSYGANTKSWVKSFYLGAISNPTIAEINAKVQTQGIYPYWAEINCQ